MQRPNVDDTDRRATQLPAHFHRVLRSFALRTQTAGHHEFVSARANRYWCFGNFRLHCVIEGLHLQRICEDSSTVYISCLCLYVFASALARSAGLLLDFHRKSCGPKMSIPDSEGSSIY
jgi:hypothetical protein